MSLLQFHHKHCLETSPLLLQRALSSGHGRQQISQVERKMLGTDLDPAKTTIHFRPLESWGKKKTVPFAKSTQAPEILLTTSYPPELGILRTSVSRCDKKRRVLLLPRGPSGFPSPLFLIPTPTKPVKQSWATRREILPSAIPSSQNTALQPSPAPAIWAWVFFCHAHTPPLRGDVDANLVFIQTPVPPELSDLLFLMAMQCTVTLPLGLGN